MNNVDHQWVRTNVNSDISSSVKRNKTAIEIKPDNQHKCTVQRCGHRDQREWTK